MLAEAMTIKAAQDPRSGRWQYIARDIAQGIFWSSQFRYKTAASAIKAGKRDEEIDEAMGLAEAREIVQEARRPMRPMTYAWVLDFIVRDVGGSSGFARVEAEAQAQKLINRSRMGAPRKKALRALLAGALAETKH